MSRIISSAEAFRDTSFRKDFALRWDYWHRQSDRDIAQLLQDKSEERRKILADKIDLEQDGRQLSPAGQKLLNAAEFEIGLGRFELTLRRYERMPWKDQDNAAQRQADMFRHVAAAFGSVVLRGLAQRMDELRSNWPQVEPLSFQKVDLLGGDRQQAESAPWPARSRIRRRPRPPRPICENCGRSPKPIASARDWSRWRSFNDNKMSMPCDRPRC